VKSFVIMMQNITGRLHEQKSRKARTPPPDKVGSAAALRSNKKLRLYPDDDGIDHDDSDEDTSSR
jgi:hypothetical protein